MFYGVKLFAEARELLPFVSFEFVYLIAFTAQNLTILVKIFLKLLSRIILIIVTML